MKQTILILSLLFVAIHSFADKKSKSNSTQPRKTSGQSTHTYVISTITSIESGAALTDQHSGYIVYRKDTLSGYVNMGHDTVYVSASQNPSDKKRSFLISDTLLQTLMVVNPDNYNNLLIARLQASGNTFYRVLHVGKVSLYDNTFTFPAANNIEVSKMKIIVKGDEDNEPFSLGSKNKLIKLINKTYGTNMNTQIAPDDMISILAKLD